MYQTKSVKVSVFSNLSELSKAQYLSLLLSLIAGAALPFAFAPFNFWPLAFLSPLLLLLLWQDTSPKQAFYLGMIFGIGFFGLGATWVYVSIHNFGNTDVPLAMFITALFVLILSSYLAFQGYVLRRFFQGHFVSFCLLGFPALWVLFEWLRSELFGGFPWLYLGYSQLPTPLKGFAPFIGVYGLSYLVLFCSGAMVLYFHEKEWKKKGPLLLLISLIWGSGHLLSAHSFTQSLNHTQGLENTLGNTKTLDNTKTTFTVSLVQGNVSPLDKFSFEQPLRAVEQYYGKLTKDHWQSDLIIWPENAIPFPLPDAKPYIDKLKKLADSYQGTLITGIQTRFNEKDYYNSLIAVGNGSGIYHKRHLVPFGEFLPFESMLRGLINFFDIPMSNFVEGPDNPAPLYMKGIQLVPLICYEIAYPQLVRNSVNKNSNAIVTLSEDGWFGSSWGPHQHLEIAQMRALETGRYILRSTPSGITAIIKPDGSLAATAPQFQATVLTGSFEARQGETPWMMMGQWPLLFLFLLMFVLPGRILRYRNSK